MAGASKIEWTDATWNPTRGCSRVSEGCRNCYAERVAVRFSGKGQPYDGLAVMKADGPHWTGKVRLVEELLDWPLRRRKPLRIFVNSMSDLFHEGVSEDWLGQIFTIMGAAKKHIFQVLTKRPERMLSWMNAHDALGEWPPPNVWLGVSVEDQATANERIPLLLQTPAAVRWISAEPLLGPMDLTHVDCTSDSDPGYSALEVRPDDEGDMMETLDWVVVGGESGPGARPMDVQDWAYPIVEQCKATGVPVFVKQLGSRPIAGGIPVKISSRKGGELDEMPEYLRVRQFPEARA